MNPLLAQVAEIGWTGSLRVEHAEGACERVLGRPPQALIGLPVATVLGTTEARVAELNDRARRAGEPAVEFVSSPAGHEPRTLRLVLGVQDQLVRAAVMDLDAALVGAPPIQISRLSSSLSHELRNPLSSVKMAVQTLAKNAGHSERDQRRLRIANREIRTIERMLSLLSEYGRTSPPTLEHTPLRHVLSEAIALVEPELAEREVHLEPVDNGEDGQTRVRVDLARLRPVLAQLLLNVASGLPVGTHLPMTMEPTATGPRVRVPDPSGAVPAEEQATLFEPFGSRLARGAGLSLAALHRTMTSLGGTVTVEERKEGGAEYRLVFAT